MRLHLFSKTDRGAAEQRRRTVNVEIVVIGNELLLGDIADTNTHFIARALREGGFELRRVVTVGDHLERIVSTFREAAERADAVIATGGLGPTVDDPTREAAAKAGGVELVFHPELWEAIQARFQHLGRSPTENNRKQAYIPEGSSALPNPFGTAPGFSMEIGRSILLAVPGVPSEMEAMIRDQVLPALQRRSGKAEVIRKRTLHIAGLGESQIDQQIGRWESMENPTAGLMAHAGLTDIRIIGRAGNEAEALEKIAVAEKDIRSALGEYIVGADEETLSGAVLRLLPRDSLLVSVESGSAGTLAGLLGAEASVNYQGGLVIGTTAGQKTLTDQTRDWRTAQNATHAIGLMLTPAAGGYRSEYVIQSGNTEVRKIRTYLVPHTMACRWAANTALTALWNILRGDSKG
jgi:nicotinamide-nucleotide amidase